MKTKMQFVGLLLSCLLSVNINAQYMTMPLPTSSQDWHYFAVLDSFMKYTPIDSSEGGDYNKIKRKSIIWGPRLFPHGDFSIAAKAHTDYATAFQNAASCIQNGGAYTPNWTCLGPLNTPSGSNGAKGMGQIHRITFHPNYGLNGNATVYAGTSFGGLWVSYNAGDNWTNLNTDNGLPISSVSDIAVPAQAPNFIFISTGDADQGYVFSANVSSHDYGVIDPLRTIGVYRSRNAGSSWENINGQVTNLSGSPTLLDVFSGGGTIHRLIVNPQDPNEIFIGSSRGVFRCQNALDTITAPTWQLVLTENGIYQSNQFRGLAFKPGSNDTLYASGVHIYVSTDGGTNWKTLSPSLRYFLQGGCSPTYQTSCSYPQSIASSDPMYFDLSVLPDSFYVTRSNIEISKIPGTENWLYAYFMGYDKFNKVAYIYRYTPSTGWQQYNKKTVPLGQFASCDMISTGWLAIKPHPTDTTKFYFGDTRVNIVSTDTFFANGANRLPGRYSASSYSGDGTHADIHALEFAPRDTGRYLFCGNDGGVSMKDLNDLANYLDFTTGCSGNTNSSWTYKHNGLTISTSWQFDDFEKKPSSLVMGNQDCGSYYSSDGGNSWTIINGGDGFAAKTENVTNTFWVNSNSSIQKYVVQTNGTAQSVSYGNFPNNPFTNTGDNHNNSITVVNHPHTDSVFVGMREVYSQTNVQGAASAANWKIQSKTNPLYGTDPLMHIQKIAISESDPNNVYILNQNAYMSGYNGDWGKRYPRIFKSTTGFINGDTSLNHFIDLKDSLPKVIGITNVGDATPPVTDIVISPNDPEHIWITFSGYFIEHKVWESMDGGLTWQNADPNATLCNFPVNAIVYQPGTNDRLYIATDIGIFVRNTSNGNWEKYGDFPHVRVMNLKINNCLGKLRCGTFGRGIWEGDLLPRESDIGQEIEIATNRTWSTERVLTNNVRIRNNATLTVTSTVNMPRDGYIFIEPGAKLIVNGGTLTNPCGETWDGIIVDGQAGLGQAPSMQGSLILTNATIEHAKEAVRVHDGFNSIARGGGIVEAENTLFRNNWRSVEYSSYHQFNPLETAEELNNRGRFNNCTFVIDSNMRDFNGSVPFRGHVSMWDVHGVKFGGCTFENRYPSFAKAEDAGYGILTIDAQFFLYHLCSGGGCTSYDSTVFYRLYDGVRVSNISTVYAPTIDRALFKDCHYGVFNDGVRDFSLTRSSFEVGGFPKNRTGLANIHEGVVLNDADGFFLQENKFTTSSANPTGALRVGSRAAAIGGTPNAVRKNEYEGLLVGNLANGINGGGGILGTDGLQFLCNENASNTMDITIARDTFIALPIVAEAQGSGGMPAGNTFTSAAAMNIWNGQMGIQTMMNYFLYDNDPNQEPNYVQNVSLIRIPIQNYCLSDLPSASDTIHTGVVVSSTELATFVSGFYTHSDDYETAASDLAALIDEGNTAYWVDEVTNANSGNAEDVSAALMSRAPWMSRNVLEALLLNSAFTAAQQRNVLEQHPDLLRRVDFMQYIIDNPGNMNQDDIDYLLELTITATARTEAESELAYYAYYKTYYANRIIRNYLNDTSGLKLDSLEIWLKRKGGLETSYQLVNLYWQAGYPKTAVEWIDSIETNFALSAAQMSVHNDFKELKNLLLDVDTSGRSIFELNSTEITAIETIAEKGEAFPHIQAQNILNAVYYEYVHYAKPAFIPEELEARPMMLETEKAEANALSVKVRPNPAHQWVVFDTEIAEDKENVMLYISDLNGRIVYSKKIASGLQSIQIDTAMLNEGIYYYWVAAQKERSKALKLVIVKP